MSKMKRFPPYTLLLTYSGMLLFYLGGAALFSPDLRSTFVKIIPWVYVGNLDWILFLSGIALLSTNWFRVRSYSRKKAKKLQDEIFVSK
jgi:hypothetical protein